ncbi:MAG: outer membrane beta-barrel protein [Muribaculaceae bacterium]|nr:outer membrane beta-barrel protein [Muribaculaceae bacterium]
MFRRLNILLASVILSAFAAGIEARSFVDFSRADHFLDIDVHAIGGGHVVTENYLGCFSEISEMNTSAGPSIGMGVSVVFGLHDWFGVGTQLNLMFSRFRSNMAVTNETITSVSNIFLRNQTTTFNIPVFVQFRFNAASNVRWKIDTGMYYSYGIDGRQKQSIYTSQVNSLGQLVNNRISDKVPFYNSSETFINSYHRADIGLHIGTSLEFSRRFSIGGIVQFGLKNVACIPGNVGIKCPNIHNLTYCLTIGYNL